jgi:DNA-directed RNA polymerase specialized sigma subunit
LAEDLLQVGYVGLVAAINNFDPAVGCSLATYARSATSGRIIAELSDAARPFLVRAVHHETRGWQWVSEPL